MRLSAKPHRACPRCLTSPDPVSTGFLLALFISYTQGAFSVARSEGVLALDGTGSWTPENNMAASSLQFDELRSRGRLLPIGRDRD